MLVKFRKRPANFDFLFINAPEYHKVSPTAKLMPGKVNATAKLKDYDAIKTI